MILSFAVAACGDGSTSQPGIDADPTQPDASPGTADAANPPDADTSCTPLTDFDGDGIESGLEGCEESPERDTDGDGTPDWLDTDSDNDGVADQFEDRNGDGMIGNCDVACSTADECPATYSCSLPSGGGGSGWCVHPLCMDGETDPRSSDTDGDAVTDGNENTRICNPMTEMNPDGLKPFKTASSNLVIDYATPDWKIAMEPDALEGVVDIATTEPVDSAFTMDLSDPNIEVAGFVVTRAVTASDGSAVRGAQLALEELTTGGVSGVSTSETRAAGIRTQSLDGYDTVIGTSVLLTTSAFTDVTDIRQKVVTALSGHPAADLTFPPPGWTPGDTNQFIVVFQTMLRSDLSQIVHMGAVVARADYDDRTRPSGYFADDLGNGTMIAKAGNGEDAECEQFWVTEGPKADIIWVLDQSGSMSDDLANVAANSTTFFNYAVSAGLDFRMGVSDMNDTSYGIFATRSGVSSTGDRWLLPTELTQFQADVNDPSGPDPGDGGTEHGATNGAAVVTRHSPRSDTNVAMIREEAELVVILVSDEHPEELEDAGIFPEGDPSPATADQLSDAVSELKPYIDIWMDEDATVHAIVVPEPWPSCSTGGGEMGYGYHQIVEWFGGVLGDLCASDLGASMQAIIDDILGTASPIVLEWVPIASTITVSRDGQVIPRSRDMGWDYNPASNSIVFFQYPFDPADPSEVVVSYQRWAEQVPID